MIPACVDFIEEKMKKEFTEVKPPKLSDIYEEGKDAQEPIIFILSPGVDPSDVLNNFARQMNQ